MARICSLAYYSPPGAAAACGASKRRRRVQTAGTVLRPCQCGTQMSQVASKTLKVSNVDRRLSLRDPKLTPRRGSSRTGPASAGPGLGQYYGNLPAAAAQCRGRRLSPESEAQAPTGCLSEVPELEFRPGPPRLATRALSDSPGPGTSASPRRGE
eukprot:19721-Hanusia_phi.AAC.1